MTWVSSVAKELPTSALICILVLYAIYKIIRVVLWFLVAWRGVGRDYGVVNVGSKKVQLMKDQPSEVKKSKQENDKQPTGVEEKVEKVIPFPDKKSNNQK